MRKICEGSNDELTEQELVIGSLLYKLQLGFTYNVHMISRLAGEILNCSRVNSNLIFFRA